ncbi:MAG TPA: nucleotidyltransferase family protein [Holophaga sp.]|nr:nucleotidyltransferase family protein [Holophaga sp.]
MKIPAVILAAGASKRLGQPKQLLLCQGEPLVRRTARTALEVCDPVLAIVGSGAEGVRAALEGLPVQCVTNLDWEEGMASSLRVAVSALPLEARAAVFLVCDQPALRPEVLERMLQLHRAHPGKRIACAYAGIRGIPALLPSTDFDALLQVRGDCGARGLLGGREVLDVDFPGGELDIDLPGDMERLRER